MSAWTNFRNSVESLFTPVIQESANFAGTIKSDAESQAKGDLSKAFVDAYSVYGVTPGTFQVKIIAAISAFLLELIGDVVTIVEKDVTIPIAPAPTA